MVHQTHEKAGPLRGLTILELVGIGPGPFCGMMLADMGARIVSIERASSAERPRDALRRGRESIALDLKRAAGVEAVLRMCERADAIFEGFRPGVVERLGVGPEACRARNPRLVYGRVTGWGREGPLAAAAGHDINFVALSGALHAIGPPGGPPVPPLNLLGDFAAGGMLLAFGLVCALLEARRSRRGQVVDAAMIDGAAALTAPLLWYRERGWFDGEPGTSVLGGAAPYYGVYETADRKWVAVGAIEPDFYRQLIDHLGLDTEIFAGQDLASAGGDRRRWPELRRRLAEVFRSRTRAEWCELLEGTDVCFAPVLSLDEAPGHPHHLRRGTYAEVDGEIQPAPAPRFDRTPPAPPNRSPRPGEDSEAVLASLGFSRREIEDLREAGALT